MALLCGFYNYIVYVYMYTFIYNEAIQYSHIRRQPLLSRVPMHEKSDQANTQELCDSSDQIRDESRSKVWGRSSRILKDLCPCCHGLADRIHACRDDSAFLGIMGHGDSRPTHTERTNCCDKSQYPSHFFNMKDNT